MKEALIKLRDKFQLERKDILDRLQYIDGNLESIDRVLSLVDGQTAKQDPRQIALIKTKVEEPVSERFKDLTFFKSIEILFKENPEKMWKPVEIANAVLKEGYTTNSKNFKNTVRTLLMNLRKDGRIHATRTKGGWLYGVKKEPLAKVFEDQIKRDRNYEGSEPSNHSEPSY